MDFDQAKQTLLEELRRHALIIGEVTLTSGATAQYYVDAKRAILRPAGFAALGTLVAGYAAQWEATAVGGRKGVVGRMASWASWAFFTLPCQRRAEVCTYSSP